MKTILTTIALSAFALMAHAGPAEDLEKQAMGYWGPDADAMMKVYTEEKGMTEENAGKVIEEGAKMLFHAEPGKVHIYTMQGIMTTPYEVVSADKDKDSLTLRAKNGPDAPQAQAITIIIKDEQITATGGKAPFTLKKLSQKDFVKLKSALPARKIGP